MPQSIQFAADQSLPSHVPVFRIRVSRTDVYAAKAISGIINGDSYGAPAEPMDHDWAALALSTFAEDWDSPEDAVYDNL